jgi:DNA-binding beta-propeller fold protein YncE
MSPYPSKPAGGLFPFKVLDMCGIRIRNLAILVAMALAIPAAGSRASGVEWEIIKSLDTGARPVDVAISADGRSVFVLTEDGTLSIYTSEGSLTDKISLGYPAERIAVAPDGERIYVTSRQGKRVDVIQLDYVREINVSGAPFKGPEKAPVTIAVFSDFQ